MKDITKSGFRIPGMIKKPDKQSVLEERARLLAMKPESKDDMVETIEVQAFHLGEEYLGVPTEMVREIQPLHALRWSRVPCVPPFIIGIVNLRGRIYSIMDLAVFWGMPQRQVSERAHILLVSGMNENINDEVELTLIIDDCAEVRLVPADEIKQPPPTISERVQGYLLGVTPDMMMVVDLKALFSDPGIIVSEAE